MSNRRAAIYVRISRDRVGGGLGVDRQEADCRQLADRLGVEVVAVHSDNDISAYSGKRRPGYTALLEQVRAGRVDVVLCWHTDRLHRSPTELETWIDAAEPHGVQVHGVKAGALDLATPSGRMVARQLGAVARYESEHRAERVAAQKAHAREAGHWLGGARPFGYEADGLTLRHDEADLIRSGTLAILSGSTLRSVVKAWNEAGIPTSRGRTWTHRNTPLVLRRWRNAGLTEHDGAPGVRAEWESIVSVDQVREVRAVLDGISSRHRAISVGSRARWLLSGIAECPCGAPLRAVTSKARPRVYRCAAYELGGTDHVSRQADPIDTLVEDVIESRLARGDITALVQPTDAGVDVSLLRRERDRAEQRLGEIAGMLGDDDLTPEQARTASAKARARLDEANRQLAAAERSSPLAKLAAVADPVAWWRDPETDIDDRRAVVRGLLRIVVQRTGGGRRRFDPATVLITPAMPT